MTRAQQSNLPKFFPRLNTGELDRLGCFMIWRHRLVLGWWGKSLSLASGMGGIGSEMRKRADENSTRLYHSGRESAGRFARLHASEVL